MLHILLLILKIIGILLAVLLGIILLALVCILVIPVRYHIEAEGKLGNENPVHAGVNVSWLLHLINVAFVYSGTACLKVRVFCFTVFDSSRKKKRKVKKKGRPSETGDITQNGAGKKAEETAAIELNADTEKENNTDENGKDTGEESRGNAGGEDSTEESAKDAGREGRRDAGEEGSTEESKEDAGGEGSTEESGKDADRENSGKDAGKETDIFEEKKSIWGKIKAFFLVLKHFFSKLAESLKNIEYTIKKICDKIKGILRNIRYYTEVLKSEAFSRVWAVSKKQLLGILRMLRPTVCRIHLLAGTGDPAGAGQILAIYGILYPFIGNSVLIEADFEKKVIEGELFIKGRIRMLVFLLTALRLLADRNTWRLLKMLKKPFAGKSRP